MNPKSLLPLPAVATAEPPEPGAPAPGLPGETQTGPAVVAFLRHPGCPFAEQTMHALRNAARADNEPAWIAVSHASRDATDEWAATVGGRGDVELVVDEQRSCYGAWGVGRTGLSHFAGARSLRAVADLARRGVRNRHAHGSRWQGAATFAVDRSGTVRWRHLPEHAGDLPDLAAARAAALG